MFKKSKGEYYNSLLHNYFYYMKKYMIFILIPFILSILGTIFYKYKQLLKYKELYSIAVANNKAYEQHMTNSKEESRLYQLTIAELNQSKDSLIQELLKVKKKRKIKDKDLQSLLYQISKINKTDTIALRDTIFLNNVCIDTLLTDKQWYSLKLQLKYPSTIITTPSFISERYVLISAKKETIKPPSKIFFIRWFQKKHTIIKVDIEERNPYINIDRQKYIKVIK